MLKFGQRVMYRYLNKGRSLFGIIESVTDQGCYVVRMDDKSVLIRSWKSWDIQE